MLKASKLQINIAGNPEKAAPLMEVLHIKLGVPTDRLTDRPTDRRTDLLTDIVMYRAAGVQLKKASLGMTKDMVMYICQVTFGQGTYMYKHLQNILRRHHIRASFVPIRRRVRG